MTVAGHVEALRLVDHHVHGAFRGPLDAAGLAAGLTESPFPAPDGTSYLDSPLGFAVRRWCAPVLDLAAHAPAGDYLARRAELGAAEVNRRFLAGAGLAELLVDTGYRGAELLSPAELGAAAGAPAREIVRLEAVAEDVAAAGVEPDAFAADFAEAVAARSAGAAGLKSVIAYRHGLDLPVRPPSATAVTAAARHWLAAGGPLADPVLLAHVVWTGVATGLPVQFHVGYGDPDLTLHRTDPSLLTPFLRAISSPVVLLHCYPYHRTAAYLAAVFPHVHLDVGLTMNHVGARAAAVLAEVWEVAPFAKVLYSSDAFGPAELHFLGARLWRGAVSAVLDERVAAGDWSGADARRVAELTGSGNARRIYG
jgi:uncharacterized protein